MGDSFAEVAVGVTPPRSFILDASVLDMQEEHEILREDIRQNRIEFEFPSGINQVDLLEECRALTQLDDFDVMYDLAMQMLEGKDLVVRIKNYDNTKSELCTVHIVDKMQNLRAYQAIDDYPIIITWLTEFLGGMLLKKYPVPGSDQPPLQEQEKTSGKKGSRAYPVPKAAS
jgi:hypothetical protein